MLYAYLAWLLSNTFFLPDFFFLNHHVKGEVFNPLKKLFNRNAAVKSSQSSYLAVLCLFGFGF